MTTPQRGRVDQPTLRTIVQNMLAASGDNPKAVEEAYKRADRDNAPPPLWIRRAEAMAESVINSLENTQPPANRVSLNINLIQSDVADWVRETFGEVVADNKSERSFRLLEEALAYAHAHHMTVLEALALVQQVFGKPADLPKHHLAGAFVTALAAASAERVIPSSLINSELARICRLRDVIREKQKSKVRSHQVHAYGSSNFINGGKMDTSK